MFGRGVGGSRRDRLPAIGPRKLELPPRVDVRVLLQCLRERRMKLHRLNVLSAFISLAVSCLWLAIGQTATGFIWLVCSLIWLVLGIAHLRTSDTEPHPMRRLARRLSRLLIWS